MLVRRTVTYVDPFDRICLGLGAEKPRNYRPERSRPSVADTQNPRKHVAGIGGRNGRARFAGAAADTPRNARHTAWPTLRRTHMKQRRQRLGAAGASDGGEGAQRQQRIPDADGRFPRLMCWKRAGFLLDWSVLGARPVR